MAVTEQAILTIEAKVDSAVKEVEKLQKSLDKTGKAGKKAGEKTSKSFEDVAKSAAKTLVSVVAVRKAFAFLQSTVEAFNVQAKAVAQLEAAIRSTGGAAGFTSEELQKAAKSLQGLTTFGDQDIIELQSQLLTFTNVTGDAFSRATLATLDLAERFDQDLKPAVIKVGKALDDPVRGLDSLAEAGILFSKEQKELIKGFDETGDIAAAQSVILGELERQLGGSAAAAVDTFAGEVDQLNKRFTDVKENIGQQVIPSLRFLIDTFGEVEDGAAGAGTGFGKFVGRLVILSGGLVAQLDLIVNGFRGMGVVAQKTLSLIFSGLSKATKALPSFIPGLDKAAALFDELAAGTKRTREAIQGREQGSRRPARRHDEGA